MHAVQRAGKAALGQNCEGIKPPGSMQTGVSQSAGSCRILQGPPLADPGLPALTRVYLQFFCLLHCSFSFPADPGLIDPG